MLTEDSGDDASTVLKQIEKTQAENKSNKRFCLRVLLFCWIVGLFVAGVFLAMALKSLIIDLLLALTLASAMSPIADWAEKKRIPRGVTVALVYIAVICFYAGLGALVWKPFKEQITLFIDHIPEHVETIRLAYANLLDFAGDSAQYLKVEPGSLKSAGMKVFTSTLSATPILFDIVINTILVLFLSAFFVVDSKGIWTGLLRWVPLEHRARIASMIVPLSARMGGYVRGQLLVSTCVAIIFAVGFTIIGVRYGLVLGLMAGLLNLIPFVGSMTATLVALFIAANQSMLTFGLTIGLFLLEQGLESNFITPHLLGKQVDMHPLVVLFAILIGATIASAAGAVVGVPTTAAIIYIAQEFLMPKDPPAVEATPSAPASNTI